MISKKFGCIIFQIPTEIDKSAIKLCPQPKLHKTGKFLRLSNPCTGKISFRVSLIIYT